MFDCCYKIDQALIKNWLILVSILIMYWSLNVVSMFIDCCSLIQISALNSKVWTCHVLPFHGWFVTQNWYSCRLIYVDILLFIFICGRQVYMSLELPCHSSNDLIRPLHKREQERGRERDRPLQKRAQGRGEAPDQVLTHARKWERERDR